MAHEWLEIGARRWCPDCGSHQTKSGGVWRDAMVGPYPAYNKTYIAAHFAADLASRQEPLGKEFQGVLFDNLWELYSR